MTAYKTVRHGAVKQGRRGSHCHCPSRSAATPEMLMLLPSGLADDSSTSAALAAGPIGKCCLGFCLHNMQAQHLRKMLSILQPNHLATIPTAGRRHDQHGYSGMAATASLHTAPLWPCCAPHLQHAADAHQVSVLARMK